MGYSLIAMQKTKFARLFPLLLGLVCLPISAQNDGNSATDGPAIPVDEFDRGTPRRSAEGFLALAEAGDLETAAEYLDLRNLRGEANELTGAQLARRLYVIVQRATWVDVDELVDDPAGRSNDNLPDYRDSIGVVQHKSREIRLLLQKVPRGDGVSIWKISNATVSRIPKLYEIYGYPEAIEDLRHILPNVNLLGYELFKWVILLTLSILVYGIVFLLALTIRKMLGDPDQPSHKQIFRFLLLPFGFWMVVMTVNGVVTWLGKSNAIDTWQRMTPVPILLTVWMMYAGMNLIRNIYSAYLHDREREGTMILLHPAANAAKLFITIGAALIYLDKFGVNISTVLAGLGIGGIAVALALQRPLEDILGAITLYTQQPIRVGDFCQVGDHTGTIEEIGLRMTRIRTLANTVIVLPNSRLSREPIINISERKSILYQPTLRLGYDTSPEQIRQILEGIRDLFTSHERIVQGNHRVRLKEIADDALLVEVWGYLNTTVWVEYLELAEELNLRILEIVAQAGTTLSLPTRAIHIQQSADVGKATAE
jgi:MscS family membrane protein